MSIKLFRTKNQGIELRTQKISLLLLSRWEKTRDLCDCTNQVLKFNLQRDAGLEYPLG